MNRTQLYDLAVSTAKATLTETHPAELDTALAEAAKTGGVEAADYATFKQYALNARNNYLAMAKSLLPSESAAKSAAARTAAKLAPPAK